MAIRERTARENQSREAWERAERDRSAIEAARIDERTLRFTATNIARYMDPPVDTPYPLEYAYHLLGDVRGKVVLDLGCGNGENTLMLALRGARVKAVDISLELIRVAERRLAVNGVTSGVQFMVGSAHELPLADQSVDVMFGIAILHHLDLAAAAREVRRVLRARGRGIFEEPVQNSPFLRRMRALIPHRHPDVSPFERPLTDGEIGAFARGVDLTHARTFRLPHIAVANALGLSGRLLRACYKADGKLLRVLPSLADFATVKVFQIAK